MAGVGNLLKSIGKQLDIAEVKEIQYLLKSTLSEKVLTDLVIGDDLAFVLQNENLLENKLNIMGLIEILGAIGRYDLAKELSIFLAREIHIAHFYGYTFIYHMKRENLETLMSDICSLTRDDSKMITILRGAGKKGKEVIRLIDWNRECKSYFSRYYKTSKTIFGPSDADMIMDTLSGICNDSNGQSFVFKDYNIVKHLDFLGYNKAFLERKFGTALSNGIISYLSYIKQQNLILICKKITKGQKASEYLKNIAVLVKYFLSLYNRDLQVTGVTVIGVVIIEENAGKNKVECNFCDLLSPSYKVFESLTSCRYWLKSFEKFVDFENPEDGNTSLNDIAAEILCFMAVQSWSKVLPNLTKKIPEQLKQTYLLLTPQQMKVLISDAKHVIIQGSYGSGKSILGLKKLELILENALKKEAHNERIIYINFDSKSKLHYQMEKNVKEYVRLPSRKIKLTNNISEIFEFPNELIYVCHNSAGENLSVMLQETLKLNNVNALKTANFHVIVEEYDGEMLTHEEAEKLTKLGGADFQQSNIMILAQPIMKKRSYNVGKESYERETCMFHELKNFKIVQLEEVLRCSNEIFRIIKCTQQFFHNKDSVFRTQMDKLKFGQQQQYEDKKNHMVTSTPQTLNNPDETISSEEGSILGTLAEFESDRNISRSSTNSKNNNRMPEQTMDLDQAFGKLTNPKKSKAGKNRVVSKFGFICEPRQGIDINGGIPKLVEFSEDACSSYEVAATFLALVLHEFISKNKTTVLLHISDKKPEILKTAVRICLTVPTYGFIYTESIEEFFEEEEDKKTKVVFSSNFRSVNGLEFDHVIIFTNYSEYYLKFYLPQVISRCTYDLKFVLLPKERQYTKKNIRKALSNIFSKNEKTETKGTVADMVKNLEDKRMIERLLVVDCQTCEENHNYKCFENNNMLFKVHTHSDQYKNIVKIAKELNSREQGVESADSKEQAAATILEFFKTYPQQQPRLTVVSEQRVNADLDSGLTKDNERIAVTPSFNQLRTKQEATSSSTSGVTPSFNQLRTKQEATSSSTSGDIDQQLVQDFHEAAGNGDFYEVAQMLADGVPPDVRNDYGGTALLRVAFHNSADIAQLLLQRGADPNVQDDGGYTPLHNAARWNSTDVAQCLLQHGADKNVSDRYNRTPLDEARLFKNKGVQRLLEEHLPNDS